MKQIKTSKFEEIEVLKPYKELILSLQNAGFTTSTPIQHKALEYALTTQDLLIQAPTGSGKTLIYAIKSLIEAKTDSLSHLIIAPNTLLAGQIEKMITQIIPINSNVSIQSLLKVQKNQIENVNILITTPKILEKQLIENESHNFPNLLENVSSLILDEADILLTQDFLPNLETILNNLPEERQDLLFSATYTKEMGLTCKEYLHNPKVIELPSVVDKNQIDQIIYITPNNNKLTLLHHTLKHLQFGLLIIFVNRVEHLKQVEIIAKALKYEVKTISSKTSEFERNKILDEFRNEEFDILIGTDIISRGVDIPAISHIINYSIPQDHTKYVHRIGRATRHQNKGTTINFISTEDIDKFKQVLSEHKISYSIKQTPESQEDLPIKIQKKLEAKIKHKKK